jgi:hypothetical protein
MLYVANMVLKDIAGAISWKNLGHFGDFTDLDTTGSVRIYPIPAEIQNHLKAVEVYTGSAWRKLIIKDINDIPDFQFNETWITSNFNDSQPVGFIYGNNLHILSGTITASTPGIRFWFISLPDKLTSMDSTLELHQITTVRNMTGGTVAIGLPRQFEKLFATGIIIDYKEANELPLVGREQLYDQDLQEKLKELSPLSYSEEFLATYNSEDGQEL